MKKFIFTLLPIIAIANPVDEGLLENAKLSGSIVYTSCILNPPTTDAQSAYCVGAYNTYLVNSQALNAPLPIKLSKEPSPYAWSQFDICKYEVGNVVFGKQNEVPYCPTIPK